MRKEYGKAVRSLFDKAVRGLGWAQGNVESRWLFPGQRAYCRRGQNGFMAWCLLVPDQQRESFTVEVGWSRLGRFPELSSRPSDSDPEESLQLSEYFVRLGKLAHGYDYWWVIQPFTPPAGIEDILKRVEPLSAEESLRQVQQPVTECISALATYGEQFIERAAQPVVQADSPAGPAQASS